MSVCRSFLRPASVARGARRAFPTAKTALSSTRDSSLCASIRMGEVRTRDARHRSPRRRRSTSWSFRARRRPASGAFSFGRGLDFPPFLIRSEASLYEAQAEGLHARIRRSSGNSQPLCLIREARRPGTEGAGPILAAACCSHSPARRPAHLGGFSGSVWISFPCLIHETLNRASQRALALRLTRRPGARPRE